MQCMEVVKIENFRSCRNVILDGLGAFSTVVGTNNVGKSNVLRALTLFFTDEIEPGVALDLSRDYGGRKGGRQQIRITVHFRLPETFRFPKNVQSAGASLGKCFAIRKTWRHELLAPMLEVQVEDANEFSARAELTQAAYHATNLINYRYVPVNRNPADLIAQEQSEIRGELVRRFRTAVSRRRQAGTGDAEILDDLHSVAATLIDDINEAISSQVPMIEEVRLRTPETIADAIVELGYEIVVRDGRSFDETVQGSGVQSALMFRLLHLVDSAFQRHFGWKQHAIWAIEEPELFSHTALEADLAQFFAQETGDPNGRFQIIAVTHSEIFMRYSDSGYLLTADGLRTMVRRLGTDQLVEEAGRTGVSRIEHALLKEYNRPLIVVEGKTDVTYLARALKLKGQTDLAVLASIDELRDEGSDGGLSKIAPYLQQHQRFVAARSLGAPVIVVVDWNAKDNDVQRIADSLLCHTTSAVIRMDESDSDPQLGRQFTGIERFLSSRFIEYGDQRGWYVLQAPAHRGGPYSVDRREFGDAKVKLADYFDRHATQDDLTHLEPLLQRIEEVVSAARERAAGSDGD